MLVYLCGFQTSAKSEAIWASADLNVVNFFLVKYHECVGLVRGTIGAVPNQERPILTQGKYQYGIYIAL